MTPERRDQIKNQMHIKTCARFVILANFSNYFKVLDKTDG